MPIKSSRTVKCRKLTGGRFTAARASVIIEKELPVRINGRHFFTASIAPGREKEFVTGYLFGQGFIKNVTEISSIDIKDDGAEVTLKKGKKAGPATAKASFRIVSGGGQTAFSEASRLPKINSRLEVHKKDIFRAMNTLFAEASLYRETEGVHAAGLFTADASPICIVEDIGRHNTLDKTIGHAILNKIDCRNAFIVATGRLSSEMVMKICRAGIPLAGTKTAVTDKGLETGQKCGMTIIGFIRDAGTKTNTDMEVRIARKAEMKIYCGRERVV